MKAPRCPHHFTTAGRILNCRRRDGHAGACHWWASRPAEAVQLLSVSWRGGNLL